MSDGINDGLGGHRTWQQLFDDWQEAVRFGAARSQEVADLTVEVRALTQRLEEAEANERDALRRGNEYADALLREVGEKNDALARAEAAERERDTAMAQVMVRYTKTDEDLAAALARAEAAEKERDEAQAFALQAHKDLAVEADNADDMAIRLLRARALAGPSAAGGGEPCQKCGGRTNDANHSGDDPDYGFDAPPSEAPTKGDDR